MTTTAFKNYGIKLYVKPHVTSDNNVFLNINTEQSYRTGLANGIPITDTRKAETNILVADGETIAIGGLRKKEETTTRNKVPFISDIPFVGNLFKKNDSAVVNTELLIFVMPRIIRDTQLTYKEQGMVKDVRDLSKTKLGDSSSKKMTNVFPLRAPSK
jgi:type II secretory pathway component GspD/PulD (secretin)